MAKTGRPKADVVKDRIVTIRMSDEEQRRLKNYAREHDLTITETIKEGVGLLYRTKQK